MNTKMIRILEEDHKIIKDYSDTTHIPMWYVVKKAIKRYFNKKNKE